MYQILICSVLYSIVAKKKVWIVLEKYFLLFRRELKSALGKEFQCRVPDLLHSAFTELCRVPDSWHSAQKVLPSVPSLALGKS